LWPKQNPIGAVEKEKNDPLAMLLMRDRRPAAASSPEKTETADAKLKDVELIAKKEVVFEEPGDEKGIFRRVVDKINPFSDDGKKKSEDKPPESWQELMAKKKTGEKEESPAWRAVERHQSFRLPRCQDNKKATAQGWPVGEPDRRLAEAERHRCQRSSSRAQAAARLCQSLQPPCKQWTRAS
jgi:hypothetical protein